MSQHHHARRMTAVQRNAVLSFYGWKCNRCGHPGKKLEVHHKKPLSEGGDHRSSNLEVLCVDCHKAHHGREMKTDGRAEWLQYLKKRRPVHA